MCSHVQVQPRVCVRVCCNVSINRPRQGGAAPFGIPLVWFWVTHPQEYLFICCVMQVCYTQTHKNKTDLPDDCLGGEQGFYAVEPLQSARGFEAFLVIMKAGGTGRLK